MEQPKLSKTACKYLDDAIRGNGNLMLWEDLEGLHLSIPPRNVPPPISKHNSRVWDDTKLAFDELRIGGLITSDDNRTWRITELGWKWAESNSPKE